MSAGVLLDSADVYKRQVLNRLAGKKKKEEPAAPTEKVCPYCRTKIDIAAVRCPHCTSVLEPLEEEKE